VRFTNDSADENAVSSGFLEQIIEEAEGEVELRLSARYEIPFVGEDGAVFAALPSTTAVMVKTLCRLEAVRRCLSYDFGRGSATDGENYSKNIIADYERRLEKLTARRSDGYSSYVYPPLPNLRLAHGNAASDEGYAGRIFVSSDNYGGDAAAQMPSPCENYWNAEILPR